MQVTHVQDHVTHAVIGGGATKSFGMSDSAEFFNILSNTLYSDKIGAVCRETLCNAWDAHVESGRTHLPVTITLHNGDLIIRDYGTGIHADLMETIYCVYGNSTKKNDGRQTGGFGLGCKAPFAYVDHFEVTSFHKGVRTIYRISKSSGEVGGKPGLTPIVSTSTDEHGLQVKMAIKPQDVAKFTEVLRRIARVGEMNATLNGQRLATLPFSEAKQGFLITEEITTAQQTGHRIFVRYGNVAYPMESHESYAKLYSTIIDELLNKFESGSYTSSHRLVLLAEPNTVSVTPSRESLSMTDLTVQTLGSLLTRFDSLRLQHMEAEALKRAQERVELAWEDMQPAALLTGKQTLFTSRFRRPGATAKGPMTNFEQVSSVYISQRYPGFTNFWRRDQEMRLRSLIQGRFGNRGKTQSYLADLQKGEASTWFHRRVIGPLITAMKGTDLSAPRLMVYGHFEKARKLGERYRYSEGPQFTEATKFSRDRLDGYMPFLRNLVILAYNRISIEERAGDHIAFKHWFGDTRDSLVYMVQRNEAKADAARAFFKSQGVYVIDLTKRHAWETEDVTEVVNVREYKPRKKGLPVLKSVLTANGRISTNLFKQDDVERIEKPEFLLKVAGRNDQENLDDYTNEESKAIIRLFGSKGGIVINQNQADKYLDQGCQDFIPWALPILIAEMQKNTRIHHHLSLNREISNHSYSQRELIKTILNDAVLSVYFDVADEVTQEDRDYVLLWHDMHNHRRPGVREAHDEIMKGIKGNPNMKKLVDQLTGNHRLKWLDREELVSAMKGYQNNEATRQQQASARDLLIWAIKGK